MTAPRAYLKGYTVTRHAVSRAGLWVLVCAGLGGVLIGFLTDCLHPIAPKVLASHVHQRLLDHTAVTFVALGDMGEGGDEQTQVAHAMYNVYQQERIGISKAFFIFCRYLVSAPPGPPRPPAAAPWGKAQSGAARSGHAAQDGKG